MISLYATNLIHQATITASTENLLFSKENLKHDFRTKVFRTQTPSDWVVFDFMETSEIDSIMVVDHPESGFGISTLTLELNGTANFSSPAFSQVLTFNIKHGIAWAEFPVKNYRFARLVMTSSLPYCELGKVFIGKKIAFDSEVDPDFGWSYTLLDNSIVKKNKIGQKFIDVLPRQKRLNFSLNTLNEQEHDAIMELYDHVGESRPFFMRMPFEGVLPDPERYNGMFYFTAVPSIPNKAFKLFDIGFSLEEAM